MKKGTEGPLVRLGRKEDGEPTTKSRRRYPRRRRETGEVKFRGGSRQEQEKRQTCLGQSTEIHLRHITNEGLNAKVILRQ